MSPSGKTLSHDLESLVDAYRTCEFLTVNRSGTPIAWPTVSVRQADGTFLISASIGLPQKAINVRRNPEVALLFSDPTGSGLDGAPSVLVQGTASCPDQIVTSVLQARELWLRIMQRQPASGSETKYAIGRRMMDFYYMRLLITITPTAIRAVPTLPAAGPLSTRGGVRGAGRDAFGLATRQLPEFGSAVLTAFDAQGNPTLARVRPAADTENRLFSINTDTSLRPGRASLLCHSHDELLWNLRSFVVTGDLDTDGERWILRPDRFVPGAGNLGPVAMIKMVRELRATARRYLDRRGLPRPSIPWQELEQLKGELASTG